MLTVGELAELSKVSVRTLHHYDEIGLLAPTGRSAAGYRLYDHIAVARLHQILVMRELGLPLAVIANTLDDPEFDTVAALERQLDELAETIERLDKVRTSVATMLRGLKKGTTLDNHEIAQVFDGFDPGEYADEAAGLWGDTEAYRESASRTQRYTRRDWEQIRSEMESIETAFAEALATATPTSDPTVAAIAERHRQHIDRWFYPCSHDAHAALAEIYVTDPRFARHYEQRAPGLAQYVSDAIKASVANE